MVTWQTLPLVPAGMVQPVQLLKLLPPAVDGAVRVTFALALYVRVNGVIPELTPLLSPGVTVIETPVAGFVELTVKR